MDIVATKKGVYLMRRGKIVIFSGLFFIASSLVPFSSYCQQKLDNREQANTHYQKGKQLYDQGEYEEATVEFNQAYQILKRPGIRFMDATQKQASEVLSPVAVATTKEEQENEPDDLAYTSPPATGESTEREYYIDIGDVLDISVWQMADLSRADIIVRPDGKISFPLIGDIKAQGLTLTQLDNIITEKLKAYVKSPEVSVMIKSFGESSNKIIALGEINSPGVYQFRSPPTIMEVVASAGGYTKYAVLNSIIVIRGNVMNKPDLNRVDIASILKSGRLSENIVLKPNDIVYVPRSFIGKLNTFLEVLQPVYSEYMQTLNARQLSNALHRKGGV